MPVGRWWDLRALEQVWRRLFPMRLPPLGAYVKQAMIGASTEVVGLISLGKMGTSLPYLVGPASRLTRLITDASDEDVLNPYRSQGIEVTST